MLGSAGLFAPSAVAAKPRALQAISTQMELVVPVMTLLRLATAVALAALLAAPAAMAEDAPVKHHALSLIGEPKYPADFKHFDFVNPDAPKGGLVRMAEIGSFDSLNPILYKGEAAGGLGLVYENLMADSLDEPSTSYGLIAEWASYPPDYSSVTFKLRDEARWHDGTPITPDDVIFSLEVNKAANPRMGLYYKNVSRAEATGDNEVTFYFDVKNNRELPMIMGQLTILPKHWWTGKDASGNQRDPMKTTLEPPLGSGPYRIKEVKPGRSIVYERVKDYWGEGPAGECGTVELRRRSASNITGTRPSPSRASRPAISTIGRRRAPRTGPRPTTSPPCATVYVKRQEVPLERTQPMQCFVLNLRRPQFAGPPRATGVQSRLRLRVGEQESVLRPICAGRQLLPGQRACRAADAAGGARARDPERGEGRRPARGVHQGACQPGQQDARRHAQQSAQSRHAAEGGRLGDQGRRSHQCAEPGRRCRSSSCSTRRCSSASCSLMCTISTGSASRARSAWWTRRSTPAASTASTTTSWSAISPSRIRPATSSATSGARSRPTARAAPI